MILLPIINISINKLLLLQLLLILLVKFSFSLNETKNLETNGLIYLTKYGYLNEQKNTRTGSLLSLDALTEAIIGFQRFAGINETGILDNETQYMMRLPRCGVKDHVGFGAIAKRKKRYALQGSRWKVKDITYQVTKYPLGLLKNEVDRDVKKAFKVWEEVTDLVFVPMDLTSSKLHIDIRFEHGEHGDGDAFDGPGGTLAHAYFPIYGGDVHFDASETWTVRSYKGTNLFQVAAHEFGHSLGLSHSDNQKALMAPFYRGYQPQFQLHSDDILAIQSLYGKKQAPAEPTQSPDLPPPSRPEKEQELCQDPTFDAIVTMSDKKTYVFKGALYYRLTNVGIEAGYPRNLSEDFGGLPPNIDAAFTWTNGKTYIFKGKQYWRFTNMGLDNSYPKGISKGFSGIPNDVDAAFVWSGNGKIYFMKKNQYWRFDPAQRPPVMTSYPKLISTWENVPNDLEGALQYSNGYTYFFKNGKYYRFNDRAFRVDSADPPFPRPTGYWWFGCPDKQSMQVLGMQNDQEQILSVTGADDVDGDDTFDAGDKSSSLDFGKSAHESKVGIHISSGFDSDVSTPIASKTNQNYNQLGNSGNVFEYCLKLLLLCSLVAVTLV